MGVPMFGSQLSQWRDARQRAAEIRISLTDQASIVAQYRDSEGTRWTSASVSADRPYSVLEAVLHASHAIALLESVSLSGASPVPTQYLSAALQSVSQVESATTALASTLDRVRSEQGPLRIVAGGNVQLAGGGDFANLQDLTQAVVTAADNMIVATTSLIMLTGRNKSADPVAAKSVQEQLAMTSAALEAAETASANAQAASANAQAAAEASSTAKSDAERIKTDLELALESSTADAAAKLEDLDKTLEQASASNDKVNSASGAVQALLTSISNIEANAQGLNSKISGYASTLSNTETSVTAVVKKATDVTDGMAHQSEEVQRLIDRSEAMVSGATVAGLTTAFAKERHDLDIKLRWAFGWFAIGVISLIGASVMFFIYVANLQFTGLLPHVQAQQAGYSISVAGLVSRTIILIGPLWFTQFAASRYRQLFDLRQQYSHKYNMAFSVDGFKKQAEKYSEEIAFWVFTKIGSNPVKRAKGSRGMDDPPSPLPEQPSGDGHGADLIERLFAPFKRMGD